jgi:hypothetical protein
MSYQKLEDCRYSSLRRVRYLVGEVCEQDFVFYARTSLAELPYLLEYSLDQNAMGVMSKET